MEIMVAGHLCLDIIPDWRRGGLGELKPGSIVQMDGVTFATGGAVANTGIALKRLGFDPILTGRIGDDHLGNIVRGIFEHEGIAPDYLACSPQATTSYSIVLNPPDTDRVFLHYPGTNDSFTVTDVDFWAMEAGLFHFGYPPLMRNMYIDNGIQLTELFKKAKRAGWITSLDLAQPDPNSQAGKADWMRIFNNLLPFVDLLVPSLGELLYMIDPKGYKELQEGSLRVDAPLLDDLSSRLLNLGAGIVGIKLGTDGLYLSTGEKAAIIFGESWRDRQILSPIFKVEARGTTGAGDTTIAGMLAGLALGREPEEVLTLASGVGACSVEDVSAVEGIPTLEVVDVRIRDGWERVKPDLDHSGWRLGKLGVLYGPNDA